MDPRKTTQVVGVMALFLFASARGATVVNEASYERLVAAVNGEQPVELNFEGRISFPAPITISRAVQIRGGGGLVELDGRGLNQLFKVTSSGSLELTGVRLQNGSRVGQAGETVRGGAIEVAGGSLRLENCLVRNNALKGGPATYEVIEPQPPPYIISQPGGDALGGAIWQEGGTLLARATVFEANCAVGGDFKIYSVGSPSGDVVYLAGGSGHGGAIYSRWAEVTLQDCELSSNGVWSDPGANLREPTLWRPLRQDGIWRSDRNQRCENGSDQDVIRCEYRD